LDVLLIKKHVFYPPKKGTDWDTEQALKEERHVLKNVAALEVCRVTYKTEMRKQGRASSVVQVAVRSRKYR
jgi:hypothetical protein